MRVILGNLNSRFEKLCNEQIYMLYCIIFISYKYNFFGSAGDWTKDTLCMQDKCSTTDLHPQFCDFF